MLNATEIRECRLAVLNSVTEYDRKQAGKPGYNPFALAQYIAKLEDFQTLLESGVTIKRAIMKCFVGRLMTKDGREFGLKYTPREVKIAFLENDDLTEMEVRNAGK